MGFYASLLYRVGSVLAWVHSEWLYLTQSINRRRFTSFAACLHKNICTAVALNKWAM